MELNVIQRCSSLDTTDAEAAVKTLLKCRGIEDPDAYLAPADEDFLLDFESMENMEIGARMILDCIANRKKVFINVDSDTDGVTSGTILYRWLKGNGINAGWHVSQGKTHGTSDALIEKLRHTRPDLLVLVDSLDADTTNYQLIKDMGIDILVLDHHDIDPETDYDSVITLVSSMRSKNPNLSGAGVVWKFCAYADQFLGTNDADAYLDLAATGIIADMMDMSNMENRYIAWYGFQQVQNPAIQKMLRGYTFNATSVSFSIAPLVNACCRYNKNVNVFKALICDDDAELKEYLAMMNRCKRIQDAEVSEIVDGLQEQIEAHIMDPYFCFTVQTSYGILGLIANKLSDLFHRPVLILNEPDEKGMVKGSGRAPDDLDFRAVCDEFDVIYARGHAQAFGVAVDEGKLEAFKEYLFNRLKEYKVETDLYVDATLQPSQINDAFIRHCREADHISGRGAPALTFQVTVDDYEVSTMTNGRHLVVESEGFYFIKWNGGAEYQRLCDLNFCMEPITFIGTLDTGMIGRKYMPRMIVRRIIS